jgi:hypothetical protein
MKRLSLDQLMELRRRREEKSLEIMAARQGAHRRAQARADAAHATAVNHAADTKNREYELINSMMGRNVRPATIARIQADLDARAMEQQDLRQLEAMAQRDVHEQRRELDKARKVYRERHTDTEKLKELLKQEGEKTARRQIAIGEAIEEDQGGLTPRRSQSF